MAGFVTGIACVWLATKNNIFNWPLAIVSSLFYFVFFWQGGLKSDALLQWIFIATSIYGWVHWNNLKNKPLANQRISTLSNEGLMQWFVITALLWRAWYWLLPQLVSGTQVLFWDTLTTCICIVAVVLQAQRKLQCWSWWLLANSIYIPLYISREYYATAALYSVLFVLSILGYVSWKKMAK